MGAYPLEYARAAIDDGDGDALHFCSTCAFSRACLSQGYSKTALRELHCLVEHTGPFREGGRPLQLGRVAAFAFVCIQLVAVLRIAADVLPDGAAWQALAGIGWLVAFLPWVLRSGWIYLTPRADGQPG